MTRHVIALHGHADRDRAIRTIQAAPPGSIVEVRAAKRTVDQNALMWVYLSKISMAKPAGRIATPDVWKALFMHACGHAVQFEAGLDGSPFPIGFRSSKLTKAQMADLITFVQAWAAENGVTLGDEQEAA
jgi:hypothetical protein